MPTVEDLLKVAEQDLTDKSVIEDANEYLEINPITRQIIIPDGELIFGVQHDLDGERKYFKIARYVGNNLDMSKAHIYINYRNANGDLDSYIVTDTAIEEEAVTFSWVLSDTVTAYKGEVQFVICARWSTQDGTETNRWHTTLASGTSLEGLEAEEIIKEQYPDILEQLLNLYETNVANEFVYNSETRCVSLKKNEDSAKSLLKLYTDDATAISSNIEQGRTAYVKGKKVIGTLDDTGNLKTTLSNPTFDIVKSALVAGITLDIPVIRMNISTTLADKTKPVLMKGSNTKTGTSEINANNFGDAVVGDVAQGKTFTSKNGLKLTGTKKVDDNVVDTSYGTVTASGMLKGLIAFSKGQKITGTMEEIGDRSYSIRNKDSTITIPEGHSNGKGVTVNIEKSDRDKIIPENIKKDVSILGVIGTLEASTGIDTSDATAIAENILSGKTAYVAGEKVTGTMPDKTNISNATLATKTESYTIPKGYHDGTKEVSINIFAVSDLKPENVKKGKTILGIAGTLDTTVGGNGFGKGTISVKKGSSPTTIETGLNSISEFYLLQSGGFSTGSSCMNAITYQNGTTKGVGVNASSYLKVPSTAVGTLSFNGGTVTYTPTSKEETQLATSEYIWIAFE